MLQRFEVRNFKKFKDTLVLDLTSANYTFNPECTEQGLVKTALIYGQNATGKSNLGWAIFDIVEHLTDNNNTHLPRKHYLNADSDENSASFKYIFIFDGSTVEYTYEKNENKKIIKENLNINGKNIITYQVGQPIVTALKGTETLNKVMAKDTNLSALKYIFNNTNLDQRNKQNKVYKAFMFFISNMLMIRTLFDGVSYIGYTVGVANIYRDILIRGNLEDFESFLNDSGVQCKLAKTEVEGEPTIGFVFKNKIIPISSIGSTGTRTLGLFYYWWQEIKENKISLLFIDEFDASYHFGLSREIVRRLKQLDSQIILTTHNTNLLDNDLIRPDCGFIIDHQGIGALHTKTDKELRSAHNIEKMYRAGSFDE